MFKKIQMIMLLCNLNRLRPSLPVSEVTVPGVPKHDKSEVKCLFYITGTDNY